MSANTVRGNGLDLVYDKAVSGPDIALSLHGLPESRCYGQTSLLPNRADHKLDNLVADDDQTARKAWWRWERR